MYKNDYPKKTCRTRGYGDILTINTDVTAKKENPIDISNWSTEDLKALNEITKNYEEILQKYGGLPIDAEFIEEE